MLGVGVETEYVIEKKGLNETDTDGSALCGLVAP